MNTWRHLTALVAPFLLAPLLVGCAADRLATESGHLMEQGRYEEALAKLDEAAQLAPNDRRYRQAYFREREFALSHLIRTADEARQKGDRAAAEAAYSRALRIDPRNARATAGLELMSREERARADVARAEKLLDAGDMPGAYDAVKTALQGVPDLESARVLLRRIELQSSAMAVSTSLGPAFRKPLSIQFRDASIRMVFDLIAKNTGLNFLFDKEIRPDIKVTLNVTDSSVEDILRFILVTNQLERKILNERTVLIYPKTQAKDHEYQDLMVKTFYLSNTDVKKAMELVRAVTKTHDMFADDKLNMLVMRDTPDAIRLAERLITNADLVEPEVMLDVEVLEVSSNLMDQIGIQYATQASATFAGAAGPGQFTLLEWLNRNSSMVQFTISNPIVTLNFQSQVGSANLLARPNIRVKNHEKAHFHVGDKVPVITTTSTSTGFVSESVSYLDTGLKLEVEPSIHLEDEVEMKINLEVSNIVSQVKTSSGTLAYQVGTRNATTALRVHDGDTQVLAGLIDDEARATTNRLPGLGELPVLGRLFGSTLDQNSRTEIVLLITPHVVRKLVRPDVFESQFMSGTDAALESPRPQPVSARTEVPGPAGQTPSSGSTALPVQGPALAGPTGPAPAAIPPTGSSIAAVAPTGPSIAAVTPPAAAAKAPARIFLDVPAQVTAGRDFPIGIRMDSATDARAAELTLAVDPARFRLVEVKSASSAGVNPSGTASAGIPNVQGQMDVATGRISVKLVTAEGFSGQVASLVLHSLEAQAPGMTRLTPERVELRGANGELLSAVPPPAPFISVIRN